MTDTLFRAILPVALAFAIGAAPALAKSERHSDSENACKEAVSADGEGVTSGPARKQAIEGWKAKVKSDIGADYADANAAQSTSLRCKKLSIAKHKCTLTARPCKTAEKSAKRGR